MANKVMDQLVKDGLKLNDNDKDCEFINNLTISAFLKKPKT